MRRSSPDALRVLPVFKDERIVVCGSDYERTGSPQAGRDPGGALTFEHSVKNAWNVPWVHCTGEPQPKSFACA